MQESTLFKFCLAIALLGILALFILNQLIEPPELLISEISPQYLDQKIKVRGTIQSISATPGLYILTLKQNNATIPVIIFRSQEIQIRQNTQVQVRGTIAKYRGHLEILADGVQDV